MIKDLGVGFEPVGVSDDGVVAGNVRGGDLIHQTSKAAIWNTEQLTYLPTLSGSTNSAASAISPTGIILGSSGSHIVLWKGGQIVDLGSLAATYAFVTAVNDLGDAVGYTTNTACPPQANAIAWFGGKYTPLTGVGNAIPIGINNKRQILLHRFGGPHCAFNGSLALWDNGSVRDLSGTFPGAYYAALNDSGMVVGGPSAKALDLGSGTVVEIGRLANAQQSEAKAVNSYGETVGILNDNGGASGGFLTDQSQAYLWDGSAGVLDLTDFLNKAVPNSGWTLLDAVGLNNAASEQIVGIGKLGGQNHGYLLSLNRVPLYVALGDSFSSGEGAPDNPLVWAGGWVDGTDTDTDKCHRSDLSYPFLLAKTNVVPRPFRSYACSGAWAADAVGKDQGDMLHTYHSEPPQTSHLSGDTKLITLTAGGDDAGFGDVAAACLWNDALRKLGLPGNVVESEALAWILSIKEQDYLHAALAHPQQRAEISEWISDQASKCVGWAQNNLVQHVGSHLDKLYTEIHKQAKHARVLVLLYPDLLPDQATGPCSGLFYQGSNGKQGGLAYMNRLEKQLNSVIRDQAKRHGFEVVTDSDTAFADHTLCSADRYVNIPTVDFTGLPQAFTHVDLSKAASANSGSLHPTTTGQVALEQKVEAYLKAHPMS